MTVRNAAAHPAQTRLDPVPTRARRRGKGQPPHIRVETQKEETFDCSRDDDYYDLVAAFAEDVIADASFPVDVPTERLAVAVVVRALDDACGIGVRPEDHPWTDSGNGHREDRWLTRRLGERVGAERALFLSKAIARDAVDFMSSPKRAGHRAAWFRLAGLTPPPATQVPAILGRWADLRTSDGDASSRASKRSRPRSSKR